VAAAAGSHEIIEDQLRQHLEDAMNELPQKDDHTNKDFVCESARFGVTTSRNGNTRSYSARPSPPHSIDHMLVFPGDSGNLSSDSN
jgi:hypothetical protein